MRKLSKYLSIVFVILVMLLNTTVLADFHQESKTQLKFKGSLGTMMKFLGMNKPTYKSTYLKGNVLRTDTKDKKGKKLETSHIIDLDKEVFITINHKKKKYTKMTFAEWKAQMERMMGNFSSAMDDAEAAGEPEAGEEKPDVKVDFKMDVNKTGNRKKIIGLNTEEVIIKITVEGEATEADVAEGETAEKATGGIIVTSTEWKAAAADPNGELSAFYQKLAKKIGMMPPEMNMKKMFDQLKNSNPKLADAIQQMQDESKKMEGFSVKSHTVYETYGESSAEKEGEVEEEEVPKSLGGMFGKFGKKMMKKDDDEGGSKILMESFSEILKYESGNVNSDVFAIPVKYKEDKKKR